MELELWQWLLGGAAAVLVGISKTGIPGAGILVVPILAYAFGGMQSAGIMLPMLLFADVFAVAWYRKHTDWGKLVKLFPWVVAGLVVGAVLLYKVGLRESQKDILGQIIGVIVLLMLGLYLLRNRLGEKLTPTSSFGMASTGIGAGFTTMISNAAGPIMQIYMAAHQMKKQEFVGTLAWFFFIVNMSKVPVFVYLNMINPGSLKFNLMVAPAILVGVFIGKWILPRISQSAFNAVVLVLAAASAVKLVIG